MGFFSKLFSKDAPADAGGAELVDADQKDGALSLQVVFGKEFRLDAEAVGRTLRAYSAETKRGSCRLLGGMVEQGTLLGLIGWGEHVVRMVGFDIPMPSTVIEACVAPAHYGPELKAQVRAHGAHVLLWYAGREESPLEQYVVLAAIAGVLAEYGAIAVLNEAAHTSLPTSVFKKGFAKTNDEPLALLRSLPLPMLYVGMVKYEVEGVKGVWMRTYGADRLGLADFAHLASGHDQGQATFGVFANLLSYQLKSGARFAAGHTAQLGSDKFMKLRAATKEEYFLESEGELYVAEFATAAEMNG